MSFLLCFTDFVLMSLIMLDTLSLVNYIRKTASCDKKDYTRVCFTWIFFFMISSLTSCSCTGYLGKMYRFLGLALRVYISIPILGGSYNLYHFLIEENKGMEYAKKAVNMIKSTTGMSSSQAGEESTCQ